MRQGGDRTRLAPGRAPLRTPIAPERHYPRHLRGRGRGLAIDQEAILDLQRTAGNAAVAAALARRGNGVPVTSVDRIKLDLKPAAPEGGLRSIRDLKKGAGILGLTTRGIEDTPPLFRAEQPVKGESGWTTKARPVGYLPEPILEEYWPTKGRHKIAERTYIDVDSEWERKLKQGEDEHSSDAKLAWELTWKKVADTINSLARKSGPPERSSEAATAALWKRYLNALPKDLRPDASMPSDAAQRDVLAVRGGTFFAWLWEATIVRDTRNYHEPKTKGVDVGGKDTVSVIVPGDSKIPGPPSDELLAELRKKYTPGRKIIGSRLP